MSENIRSEALVDTRWLAEHLRDARVRLVEADADPTVYDAGHIPGAVFWNVLTALVLPDFRTNLDRTAVEKLLSESGIANDTTVVVYSGIPSVAPWTLWYLKLFGHQDVRVLNGGRKKWIAEGRPLVTGKVTLTPQAYIAQEPDPALRILRDEVQSRIGQPGSIIIDVRSPNEYNGELFFQKPPEDEERAGHIPGAINVFYETALQEDGTFKPVEELSRLYREKGVTPDKEVITHCTFGGRSGHSWFVLKYLLGFENVRNYDAGWMEWGRRSDTPVER